MKTLSSVLILIAMVVSLSWAQPYTIKPYTIQPATKEVVLIGFTRGDKTMTLSSEVSGKVLKVNYDVGDEIGNLAFYEIDTTFIDLTIENISSNIKIIERSVERLEANEKHLRQEFERMDKLHKGDRTTQVARNAAENAWLMSRFQIDEMRLEKKVLEVQLREQRELKKRYQVHAPLGWIVTEIIAEKGEVVTVNSPLAMLADYRKMAVPLAVSSQELEAIERLPEQFQATLEGQVVSSSIKFINPEFNEKTRKLDIELAVSDYGKKHRGGLKYQLPVTIAAEGLMIPKVAVVNRYNNPKVTLQDSSETIQVVVLSETERHLLIAEHPKLKVGMPLQVVGSQTPESAEF